MLELSHPPRHDSGGQTNLLVYFPSCCTYCPHGQMKGNGPMDTDIIEALQSFALKMLFVAIWVFFEVIFRVSEVIGDLFEVVLCLFEMLLCLWEVVFVCVFICCIFLMC